MEPITYALLLKLVLQYGPSVVPLIAKLVENIKAAGADTEVSTESWAVLGALAGQTGEDIYARLGIAPPPAKAAAG